MVSKRKIEKKLEQLQEILDKLEEVRMINSDDPETWDSDTLYDLTENLKVALKILEGSEANSVKQDQLIKDKFDELGQPLYEDGLCSLVDEWTEKQEENEDYD